MLPGGANRARIILSRNTPCINLPATQHAIFLFPVWFLQAGDPMSSFTRPYLSLLTLNVNGLGSAVKWQAVSTCSWRVPGTSSSFSKLTIWTRSRDPSGGERRW